MTSIERLSTPCICMHAHTCGRYVSMLCMYVAVCVHACDNSYIATLFFTGCKITMSVNYLVNILALHRPKLFHRLAIVLQGSYMVGL